MEKRKPHYPLSIVHTLVEQGQVLATLSALGGAAAMEMMFDDMLDVVRALTIGDFFKKYDDPCRSPHLAGRLPTIDSSG